MKIRLWLRLCLSLWEYFFVISIIFIFILCNTAGISFVISTIIVIFILRNLFLPKRDEWKISLQGLYNFLLTGSILISPLFKALFGLSENEGKNKKLRMNVFSIVWLEKIKKKGESEWKSNFLSPFLLLYDREDERKYFMVLLPHRISARDWIELGIFFFFFNLILVYNIYVYIWDYCIWAASWGKLHKLVVNK